MTNRRFVWGQAVIILGLRIDGAYYDATGKFIKEIIQGPNKGKIEVEQNGVKLNIEPERIYDASAYFKIYNGNRKALPPKSTGRLWFQEYVESDGTRGNLLNATNKDTEKKVE